MAESFDRNTSGPEPPARLTHEERRQYEADIVSLGELLAAEPQYTIGGEESPENKARYWWLRNRQKQRIAEYGARYRAAAGKGGEEGPRTERPRLELAGPREDPLDLEAMVAAERHSQRTPRSDLATMAARKSERSLDLDSRGPRQPLQSRPTKIGLRGLMAMAEVMRSLHYAKGPPQLVPTPLSLEDLMVVAEENAAGRTTHSEDESA